MGKQTCRTCGGTGKIVCMNSAFITEKLRKERCGICGGTGESGYRDDPNYVRWQARQRETFPWHADLTLERKAELLKSQGQQP